MTPPIRAALRLLAGLPALLLVACTVPSGAPPAMSIDNVRSVEIQYQYSGWSRADEVHRLQRSGGQRAFTRTSMVETADGVQTTQATVPAQRVGELVWALSAPPWPRERAVQVVARRVPPVWIMEHAAIVARPGVPGCSEEDIRNRMFGYLSGAALRTQLDAYYQSGLWTDDYPVMRVVISFRNGPDRVLSSSSQKLLMLPWTLGDFPLPGTAAKPAPRSWSVPVSDALRRLLPITSDAARRLAKDAETGLALRIGHVARQECALPRP